MIFNFAKIFFTEGQACDCECEAVSQLEPQIPQWLFYQNLLNVIKNIYFDEDVKWSFLSLCLNVWYTLQLTIRK